MVTFLLLRLHITTLISKNFISTCSTIEVHLKCTESTFTSIPLFIHHLTSTHIHMRHSGWSPSLQRQGDKDSLNGAGLEPPTSPQLLDHPFTIWATKGRWTSEQNNAAIYSVTTWCYCFFSKSSSITTLKLSQLFTVLPIPTKCCTNYFLTNLTLLYWDTTKLNEGANINKVGCWVTLAELRVGEGGISSLLSECGFAAPCVSSICLTVWCCCEEEEEEERRWQWHIRAAGVGGRPEMTNDATGFPLFVTDQWTGKGECVCMDACEHSLLKSKISCLFGLGHGDRMINLVEWRLERFEQHVVIVLASFIENRQQW